MRALQTEAITRSLLLGFMLLFASCLLLSLFLDNYYLLCIPFGALLLLTSVKGIEILFFFLILLIPLSVEQKITSSLSTDFPDELLMWLITAILWLVIFSRKKLLAQLIGYKHPIWQIVALSLIWTFITLIFSTQALISLKYLLSKTWYISCFFILPILLFSHKEQLHRIVQLIFFSMLAVVLYAFINQASMDFSFLKVNEAVRPFFRNHVNYAALLACIIPLLIISTYKSKNKKIKILLLSAVLFCCINLVFTYSRGAWLGLFCCIPFYFVLKAKKLKLALLVSFVIGTFSILLLLNTDLYKRVKPSKEQTIYHTDLRHHLQATYELTDMSFAERLYRWSGGLSMLKSKPLFGYGPNSFYKNYKAHTDADFETWVSANYEKSSIHNYFLLQFSEQGLIGGILFISLLFIAFVRIERIYHSEPDLRAYALGIGFTLTIITLELCVNDLIETDKIGSLFYLCLASIIILEKTTHKKTNQRTEKPRILIE